MVIRKMLLAAGVLMSLSYTPGAVLQQRSTLKKEKGSTMHLSSYILFDGNCKQGMEFYRTVFGGELTMTKVGESPMKAAFPVSMHHKILNARLKSNLVEISASDWLRPNQTPVKGNVLCLYLSGGTRSQTTLLFQKLSEGAEVTDPLNSLPYGLYGALNDRFGIRWMFHAE